MLTILLFSVSLAYEAQAFYNPSTGRWLSRDPIGEEGGLNQTDFVGNNPQNYIDVLGDAGAPATPSADGFLTILVEKPARAIGNCGGAYYVVSWQVSGSVDGYVVQHFKQIVNVTDCQGHGVVTENAPEEFTEAWQLTGGSWPMGHKDTFRTKSEGSGRKGTILDVGRVKFLKNYVLTLPPWGHNLPRTDAGVLPVIKPTPPGWSDAGTQIHAMFVYFNCCCNATEQISTIP